jgi:CubicO group peptidase (beta-lactamase class C family)
VPVMNRCREVRPAVRRAVCARVTVGLVAMVLAFGGVAAQAGPAEVDQTFGRVSPEDAGFWPESLAEVAAYADSIHYAAIVLVRDGQVLFEWGDVSRNYMCRSIRKPIMSALYGIHVEHGEIDLDATIGELGIDDIPPKLTLDEKRATVRHLLQSNSGV